MAFVYITEFNGPAVVQGEQVAAAMLPPLASQTVAIGGSSAVSAAFNAGTTLVRVNADAACSIQFGTGTPVATATSMRVSAGATEYFVVLPSSAMKLAVITNT